jgi:hypothetical protein
MDWKWLQATETSSSFTLALLLELDKRGSISLTPTEREEAERHLKGTNGRLEWLTRWEPLTGVRDGEPPAPSKPAHYDSPDNNAWTRANYGLPAEPGDPGYGEPEEAK